MALESIEQVMKFVAQIDPVTVERAFADISRAMKASTDEQLAVQTRLWGDVGKLGEEGSLSVAKAMKDSITDQIQNIERLKLATKAYSEEMKALAAQVEAEGIGSLGDKDQKKYLAGLKAQEALFKESYDKRAAIQKEAADKAAEDQKNRDKTQGGIVGGLSFAGNLLAKTNTSPGGPGDSGMAAVGSGLKEMASSKSTWELLLNTTKMILNVATEFYMEDKRRQSQQLDAAGGSGQFARYFSEAGSLEAAKATQARLEYSSKLTGEEQKAVPQAMTALARSSQGMFKADSKESDAQVEGIARAAMVLGQEFTKFASTVGEISRRTGESITDVTNAFSRAGSFVDEYNSKNPEQMLGKMEFLQTVEQVTKALKDQRYTIGDVTAITARWAGELEKGTISVNEIVGAMKGMTGGDRGTGAFFAKEIAADLKKSLDSGLLTKDSQGKDLQGAELAQGQKTSAQINAILERFKNDPTQLQEHERMMSDPSQNVRYMKDWGIGSSDEERKRVSRQLATGGRAAVERFAKKGTSGNLLLENMKREIGNKLFGTQIQNRDAALKAGEEGAGVAGKEAGFGKGGVIEIADKDGNVTKVSRDEANKLLAVSGKTLTDMREDTKGILNILKESTWGRASIALAEKKAEQAKQVEEERKAVSVAKAEATLRAKGGEKTPEQLRAMEARKRVFGANSGGFTQKQRDAVANENSPKKLSSYFQKVGEYPTGITPEQIQKAQEFAKNEKSADQQVVERASTAASAAKVSFDLKGLSTLVEQMLDLKPQVEEDKDGIVSAREDKHSAGSRPGGRSGR